MQPEIVKLSVLLVWHRAAFERTAAAGSPRQYPSAAYVLRRNQAFPICAAQSDDMEVRTRGALAAIGGACDGGHAVHELGAEDDVGVAEHALLERDHDELGVGEVRLDHAPNVLGVAQVQRSIHLQHAVCLRGIT